jgi:hypothetical protein
LLSLFAFLYKCADGGIDTPGWRGRNGVANQPGGAFQDAKFFCAGNAGSNMVLEPRDLFFAEVVNNRKIQAHDSADFRAALIRRGYRGQICLIHIYRSCLPEPSSLKRW